MTDDQSSPIEIGTEAGISRRGFLLTALAAAAVIMGTLPVIFFLDDIDTDNSLKYLFQMSAFLPGFVAMGYCGIVPILWFRRPAARWLIALLAQVIAFWLLIAGMYLTDDFPKEYETLLLGFGVFIICAAGGFIPVGLLVWSRRWRMQGEHVDAPVSSVGIFDLMALVAVGAMIFAYQRHWGPFASPDEFVGPLLLITLAYMLIGAVVTSCLLVGMRTILVPKDQRLTVGVVISILGTLVLAHSFWGLVVYVDGGFPTDDLPMWAQWLMYSLVTWTTTAIAAICLCLALRKCRFRLSTVATDTR